MATPKFQPPPGDEAFYRTTQEIFSEIAPDIADFEDVVDFGREFWELCLKFRRKAQARQSATAP